MELPERFPDNPTEAQLREYARLLREHGKPYLTTAYTPPVALEPEQPVGPEMQRLHRELYRPKN